MWRLYYPLKQRFIDRQGIPATFVGHPLMDEVRPASIVPPEPGTPDFPVVGLLPGSRDREIARHLPVMLAAADVAAKNFANFGSGFNRPDG